MGTRSSAENVVIDSYDVSDFPFRSWFERVFKTCDLENLHRYFRVTAENYQVRLLEAKAVVDERIQELQATLPAFVQEVLVPRWGPIRFFQEVPTVRTHFAVEDVALVDERRDLAALGPSGFLKKHYFESYRPAIFHRDGDYGLIAGSVNLWLPVTDVEGSNGLWIGDAIQRGRDALPVTVQYGAYVLFDGVNRWHGAVWNTSGRTRVSFDVRFVPDSALKLLS